MDEAVETNQYNNVVSLVVHHGDYDRLGVR